MHPLIQGAVREVLRGRRFRRSCDLGCGAGDGGALVRPHTGYLVGVDLNPRALEEASRRGVYDELHLCDMRAFPLDRFDSVFLFDSLEHIDKPDGYELLERCRGKYVMITTPWWSLWPFADPGHRCVWTPEELRRLGFETRQYSFTPDIPMALVYGGFTLAWRGNEKTSRHEA